MNRNEIDEYLKGIGETAVLADGFDSAFLGFSHRMNEPITAVYSLKIILDTLVEDGMSYDEALEYADFNILGAWIGPQTPIYVVEIDE